MKLTKLERLLLANQYQILSKLDPQDESHDMMRVALEHGYEVVYQDKLFIRIYDGLSVQECLFVQEVMDLYLTIQRSYEDLADKAGIEERRTVFPGFDGNHEPEYLSYAHYLVNKERLFTSLKLGSDGFNSHAPSVDRYRRQVEKWKSMGEERNLTPEAITSLL